MINSRFSLTPRLQPGARIAGFPCKPQRGDLFIDPRRSKTIPSFCFSAARWKPFWAQKSDLDPSPVRPPVGFRAAEKQKDKSSGLSCYKQVTRTGFEPPDFFHQLSKTKRCGGG